MNDLLRGSKLMAPLKLLLAWLISLFIAAPLAAQGKVPAYDEFDQNPAGAACVDPNSEGSERFVYPVFSEIDTSEYQATLSDGYACPLTDQSASGDPGQYENTRDCDDQVVSVECCDSLGAAGEGFGGFSPVTISPFGNPYSERCEVQVSRDVCLALGIGGRLVRTQDQWSEYFEADKDWGKKFKALTTLMHEIRGHCLDLCYNYPTNRYSSEAQSYCMSSAYCTRKMKSVGCDKILKDKKPPDKYRLCVELLNWQMFNHIYSKFNFCLSKLGDISSQDCKKCLDECKRQFPRNIEDCNSAYQSQCSAAVR